MKKKKNGKLQLLLAALLVTSTEAFAQFGGFGGFGGGMPDMSSMFPQVKHTKVEGLKSNLPVVYITTETALHAQKKVTAHMKCEGYDGPIGIKLRGNSSLSFNQKKYTLETRDETGKELDVALLGRARNWMSPCWGCLPTANGYCWHPIMMCRCCATRWPSNSGARWDTGDLVPRWWNW